MTDVIKIEERLELAKGELAHFAEYGQTCVDAALEQIDAAIASLREEGEADHRARRQALIAKIVEIEDQHLEGYELLGEDESGVEGVYTPNEHERGLLADFGASLVSELDAAGLLAFARPALSFDAAAQAEALERVRHNIARRLAEAGWHEAANYLREDYMGGQICEAFGSALSAYRSGGTEEMGDLKAGILVFAVEDFVTLHRHREIWAQEETRRNWWHVRIGAAYLDRDTGEAADDPIGKRIGFGSFDDALAGARAYIRALTPEDAS